MPELLRMPEVATNTPSAVLASWPVAENVPFSANDVIATIETDKAAIDVEAETDGVIVRTLVSAGADVPVGEAIALLATPGETVDDVDAALSALGASAPPGDRAPHSTAPAHPAVPLELTLEEFAGSPAATGATPSRATLQKTTPPVASPSVASPAPAVAEANGRTFASPLARRLARDAGLSLDELIGTGPSGRIVRRDVELVIARRYAADPVAAPAETPDQVPAPRSDRPSPGTPAVLGAADGWTEVPHTRMRRAIATRLTQSKQTIPHFYLRGSARVDRLLALRTELNAQSPVKISVNDLVIKAVARAHRLVPAVNAIWTDDAMLTKPEVDLSLAVATDTGLVTPVLRDVGRMSISAVATATRDLTTRAREGRLQQAELEGGTGSITNLGMYGTEEFAAIINPPQSTILAVGAARREPVVGAEGALEVATVLRVTLSVDHRAVDGATAAEWMREFVRTLEEPLSIVT
jgi:pyruvate dehydrogenase E2 component (dihydrolipoamide acetyltransferase)